jgi:integrase
MADGGINFRRQGIDRLTDKAIRAWITRAVAGTAQKKKLSDGAGLYLTTTPARTAVWRLKYRLARLERVFAIGIYPMVGLKAARGARDAARELLAKGLDPTITRRVERATNVQAGAATFEAAAADWLEKQTHWAKGTAYTAKVRLDKHVKPLKNLPVRTITPAMVAKVLEAVTAGGAVDTAKKVRWMLVGIFDLARVRGLCTDNPAIAAREVMPKQNEVRHLPALTDLDALGDLLRRADLAHLSPSVHLGHRLCAFTVARIGNVLTAEWPEFGLDGDLPTWTIPREKMKAKDRDHDHTIYLGPTITAELRHRRADSGGKGYVLPSPTGRTVITHEALEKAYRTTLGMRGIHSPHSWRSSFSSLAHDGGFGHDTIEMALDHLHGSAVAQAYDRGQRREERIKLAYWWDAQLTAAQHGGQPLRRAKGAA